MPFRWVELLGDQRRDAAVADRDRRALGVGARRRELLPGAEGLGDLLVLRDDPVPAVVLGPRDRAPVAEVAPVAIRLLERRGVEDVEVHLGGAHLGIVPACRTTPQPKLRRR